MQIDESGLLVPYYEADRPEYADPQIGKNVKRFSKEVLQWHEAGLQLITSRYGLLALATIVSIPVYAVTDNPSYAIGSAGLTTGIIYVVCKGDQLITRHLLSRLKD